VPRAACAIKTAVEGPCTAELPLHGVEERHNKILPCHIVKEDGLVRITPETMTDVLAGRYNDRIGRYHVFDCRFDYEFEGGHIDGATNVSSLEHLDELLLRAFSGLNERCALPQPSASGQLETSQQVVLIFHCEFSQKRAPTFAKELRTRDRSMNLASYPKVHYPEIYILEGGYKNFYEHAPHKCEPCAYVPMTHPTHMKRCRSDMAKFERNFGRTRSFAAIESQLSSSRLAPPIALAAGTAAQGRRGNRAVRPAIAEENELDSSPLARRAQSMGQAPMLSSRALQRCATAAEFLRRL
jgi:M-phase inducer tyrosine phosphatase